MQNYKDTLAKIANQMNAKIASETATPEQNELKKRYGRIFQKDHCTLRLVERNLTIRRDDFRERLIELERSKAALFDSETNAFIPIVPQNAKDWEAITAYKVNSLEEAQFEAEKTGAQLLVF